MLNTGRELDSCSVLLVEGLESDVDSRMNKFARRYSGWPGIRPVKLIAGTVRTPHIY